LFVVVIVHGVGWLVRKVVRYHSLGVDRASFATQETLDETVSECFLIDKQANINGWS